MTERLRIAFVADTLHGDIGGAIIAGRRLVERLRDDHDVTVIGTDGADDVRLSPFQLPVRAMRDMYFVMARPRRKAIAEAIAACDVVHLHFPFWLSFVALAEARRLGKPVVAAFHVQPENALLNVGIRWRWLQRRAYRYWIRRFYGQVDTVMCPSPFAEQKLREHGLEAPTVVVSNGVTRDVAAIPWRPRRPPGDEVTIAMVGRLAAEKRQELLIEAIRRSRHRDRIRLVIAGGGPRAKALTRLAQTLPRAEVGFLPRAGLLELLQTADLFVHCSEVELEGIAVLEAMSVGLPVLVADAPESAASAFALDDDFRFPAGDVDALAARLDHLLDHPDLLVAASARSRQAAAGHDFEASVRTIVDVYRSVLPVARGRLLAAGAEAARAPVEGDAITAARLSG